MHHVLYLMRHVTCILFPQLPHRLGNRSEANGGSLRIHLIVDMLIDPGLPQPASLSEQSLQRANHLLFTADPRNLTRRSACIAAFGRYRWDNPDTVASRAGIEASFYLEKEPTADETN
jgi:hypothetical protein